MKLSLIVAVLDSYEVVRRQLLHLDRILTRDCELILLDDGSELSLQETCNSVPKSFSFLFHSTNDYRPWTQPKARNIGASLASADKLLFFDIDHIVTDEIVQSCLRYSGDKLHWLRRPGILNAHGRIVTERTTLVDHGLAKHVLADDTVSVHANSFLIRRALFDRLGGYDERFCGRYGGDDIDFNGRYEALCQRGLARPAEVADVQGFVFPDPAHDRKGLFHNLARVS